METLMSPHALLAWMQAFRFEYGVTPLADWRISAGASAAYLLVIYVLNQVMSNRPKWELRTFSLVHNFNMFVVSVLCAVGIGAGVALVAMEHGFEALFCDSRGLQPTNGILAFWMYVFWASKLYELLDTVILVLRKSELRFLHVYHHWITNLLVFWCLYFALPVTWLAGLLNAAVHIPMYLYYWLAIAGVRGLWWKKYITQTQIVQFVLVIVGQLVAFVMHFQGAQCYAFDHWLHPNVVGLLIVWSYLALFIAYYRASYADQPRRKTE